MSSSNFTYVWDKVSTIIKNIENIINFKDTSCDFYNMDTFKIHHFKYPMDFQIVQVNVNRSLRKIPLAISLLQTVSPLDTYTNK